MTPTYVRLPEIAGPLPAGEHELIVLGRGMEPGVQVANKLTTERARAAREYFDRYLPSAVFFSSKGSAMALAVGDGHKRFSEADAMIDIADLPFGVAKPEDESTTTVENFIHLATLLDRNKTTAVMAHLDQLPWAIHIGRRILNKLVVGVPAEWFGAEPVTKSEIRFEKRLTAVRQAFFCRIADGDIEAFKRRAVLWDSAMHNQLFGMIARRHKPQYN